ncbi:hypothetical protein L5515_013755 [Caenorhabditis briggsae]|uniref:Uncharacterized protein n=1 Tax=Caenorhabditis briggsae TaxID=6238 RepID=A0AAE9EB78_CAEBR|nr:hypothetical protein L5515_013755 [Caenorhabditis briggsae]
MLRPLSLNESDTVLDLNCTINVINTAKFLKNQLQAQAAQDNKFGADMYAVTIIGAFASVIVLLMFRSIRPHQSLDDQVTLMMSTMKMRVEVDEYERRKIKMKEAKKKAQDWINNLKNRSMRSLSRSSRRSKSSVIETPPYNSDSTRSYKNGNSLNVPFSMSQQAIHVEDETRSGASSTRQSVCRISSAPTPHLEVNLPVRCNSHLGFLPEIVVTEERPKLCLLLPPPTRRRKSVTATSNQPIHKSVSCQQLTISRKSSMSSAHSVSPSLSEEIVFNFPDSGSATPNDSPPYEF